MVGNPRNLLLTSVQSHLRFCSLTQHEANSTVVFVCAAASAESPEDDDNAQFKELDDPSLSEEAVDTELDEDDGVGEKGG